MSALFFALLALTRPEALLYGCVAGFLLTVAAYIYYSVWLLLTPFVEKEIAWFHALFPDTWWALAVPTALLVLGLTCVCTFVGLLATADGIVSLRR